jgi:hypothetical protein
MTERGSEKKPEGSDVSKAMAEAFRVPFEYKLIDESPCTMRRMKMSEFLLLAPKLASAFARIDWGQVNVQDQAMDDTGRGYAFMVLMMAAAWPLMQEIIKMLTPVESVADDFEEGLIHVDAFLKVHKRLMPTFFSIVATFGGSVSQEQIASISGPRSTS